VSKLEARNILSYLSCSVWKRFCLVDDFQQIQLKDNTAVNVSCADTSISPLCFIGPIRISS
jgi:hypothetical protein